MSVDDKRAARVSERVQKEIASLVVREVKDPRVVGVAITGVKVSPDLQIANVYIRVLQASPDEKARRDAIAGLTSASGMLRKALGQRLGLPHAPRLVFRYDEGLEKRQRIDALLDEIAHAPKAKGDDEE